MKKPNFLLGNCLGLVAATMLLANACQLPSSVGSTASQKSNWLNGRGDPQNTGRSATAGLARSAAIGKTLTANLAWTYTGGGSGANSFPVIDSEGTIYFAASDGTIRAVLPNGTEKWNVPKQHFGLVPPVVGPDGRLYGGDFQDFFYCFDPKDGKILWSVDFGQPSSGFVNAPIILPNGMMYVLSWDGNLYCIDPNGKQQWAFNSSYSFQGTPSVSTDGTVYVMSNKLYGINGLNGQKLWDFAPPNLGVLPWFFESTPVIGSDGTIYVIGYCRPFIGNALYLFAVNTNGVEKWRYQLTDGTSFISDGQRTMPALQSDGTLIVAVSGNQTVVAINPDGTKKAELALSDPLAPNASPSIDALGRIYITLRYGFTCVKEDLTTQIWSKLVTDGNNGIFFQSSPSLGSDAVYITSQDGNYSGELYAVPLGQ